MKLKVEELVYRRRLSLMAEMILEEVPALMIHRQAQLILECYEVEQGEWLPVECDGVSVGEIHPQTAIDALDESLNGESYRPRVLAFPNAGEHGGSEL